MPILSTPSFLLYSTFFYILLFFDLDKYLLNCLSASRLFSLSFVQRPSIILMCLKQNYDHVTSPTKKIHQFSIAQDVKYLSLLGMAFKIYHKNVPELILCRLISLCSVSKLLFSSGAGIGGISPSSSFFMVFSWLPQFIVS